LHLGERFHGAVDVGERDILPMWVGATPQAPVALEVTVTGRDDAPVRVAVLGHLAEGAREVLGSAGYTAAVSTATVTVTVDEPGQIVVVVGSHGLADFAAYEVTARCANDACSPEVVDALVSPKLGGLVGQLLDDGSALVGAHLQPELAFADH